MSTARPTRRTSHDASHSASQTAPAKTRTPAGVPVHPRRRRTQAERTQLTQQKLIEGTITLLKQKRYAGFRISDVAAVAGVSRGAQTHHFPLKDDLVLLALEAVFRQTHQQALARIAAARAEPATLLDALIADSEAFFLGEDFYLSLDLMMVGADQPLGQQVKRLAKEYRLSVERAWLDAFIEAGHDAELAEDVVLFTFSIARGMSIRKLMSGETRRFARMMGLWRERAAQILQLH